MKLLTENFCEISPHKLPNTSNSFGYVVLEKAGKSGGTSIKLGNIALNWRKLFRTIPTAILTLETTGAQTWFVALGALLIWMDLYSQTKVVLDCRHAIAIRAMWENHNGKHRILEEYARQVTNQSLISSNKNTLDTKNFVEIIDQLEKIGCLEISNGEIWLREWINREW